MGSFVERLRHVTTLRRQILVACSLLCVVRCVCCWCAVWVLACVLTSSPLPPLSPCVRSKRTPSPLLPVCTFKTSPCVPAPHPHVFTHVDVVLVHTGTFWLHTLFFQRATPDTPHHTTPHTHIYPNHNPNRSHTRQRQRQRTHNDTQRRRQPTWGSTCFNTEKLTRSRHSKG